MSEPSRSTTMILEGALSELLARRDRLQPFVDELRDVAHSIAVLEKALNLKGPKAPRKPAGGGIAGESPRGRFTARALGVLREAPEPMTTETIADLLGSTVPYVTSILNGLAAKGDIEKRAGRWQMASPIGREDAA